MSLARRLFRPRPEERLSIGDWAEMFSFAGNSYPINYGSSTASSSSEPIENDFEGYIQGAYKRSGVVYACIVARGLIFSEARFMFQQMNKGRGGDLFSTPALSVLENPWDRGTSGELLMRALQDVDLAGNHYVVNEGFGQNKRLRRFRPDWVDIMLSAPPDKAVKSDVTGHVYKPGGTQDVDLWEIYPIDGSKGVVSHWSPLPDPAAQYRGMSWLTPVLTDITADIAMDRHKSKFFTNGATPQLAVSMKESVTPEQFEKFMAKIKQEHQGVDSAYKTMFLAGGADVHVVGTSLQQMDFKVTQGHGETRICAAARIHPALVGLAEIMHGTPLNQGNFQASKDLLGDGVLKPMWRSICAAYAPLVNVPPGTRLWFDDRDIAFLRQDREKVALIGQTQASTIASYVQAGFTPDSSIAAVQASDLSLLKHTGLYSVQLLPPGTISGSANDPGSAKAPAKPPIGPASAAPKPSPVAPAAPVKGK